MNEKHSNPKAENVPKIPTGPISPIPKNIRE